MYGAILGDIIGEPYEFYRIKTTDFLLVGDQNRYTDDSVMTIAVADGIMQNLDATDKEMKKSIITSMRRYGRKHPDAGYGGMFANWIENDNSGPYNSFGNGAAMRVSSVAWLYPYDLERALHVAKLSAEVTHNHPEGIKAAEATTEVIWRANKGQDKDDIRTCVEQKYYSLDKTCDEIRPTYRFDVTAQGTMPAALAAFFQGNSFEEVVRLGVSLGGDSDTIGAIAGAMAEAYYGIPHHLKYMCIRKLAHSRDMYDVLNRFSTFIYERDLCF